MPRSTGRDSGRRARGLAPWWRHRLVIAVAVLAGMMLVGTVGYVWIEGMDLADAVYMTVITVSTVGYGEVEPLSEAGHWFTVVLIIGGVGATFYTIGALAEFLIEGRFRAVLERRHMSHVIESLRGHVIVCGFGRLGRAVCETLRETDASVVVVDANEALRSECEAFALPFLAGSALEESVLAEAGIERAATIVAATPSDSDNVFIALSAREANPDIRIHARAETPGGVRKLRLAGATQVISPHALGGRRIANAIVRPAVVEFLELTTPGEGAALDLEEVALSSGAGIVDLSVGALAQRGIEVAVIAIKDPVGPLRLSPGPEEMLRAGDHVIVVGDRENLERLAALAEPA